MGGGGVIEDFANVATLGGYGAAKKLTGLDKLEKQKEALKAQEGQAAAAEGARKSKAAEKLKRKKDFQDSLTSSGGAIDVSASNVKKGELFGR